ncbi:MAG: acyltransferase domain-containing protein [Pseudomonadales bacterium]|nr:acyltransferase domain-containing protein [Pseudomonadales bacterium]
MNKCSSENQESELNLSRNKNHSKTAFLFSDKESRYAGMGMQLYLREPLVRKTIDQCDQLVAKDLGVSLKDAMISGVEWVEKPEHVAPVVFALEYALAKLWISWGIVPSILVGYGIGEYVAACIAGVFVLEDALKLVVARGNLEKITTTDDSILTVYARISEVENMISGQYPTVSIVAYDGPEQVILSGEKPVLMEVKKRFLDRDILTSEICLFHFGQSSLMDPLAKAYRDIAAHIDYRTPNIPVISNTTGKLVGDNIRLTEYWLDQLLSATNFHQAIRTLESSQCRLVIEISAHPDLSSLAKTCYVGDHPVFISTLEKGQDDWHKVLTGLASAHCFGVKVNWQRLYNGQFRDKIDLPDNVFDNKKHYLEGFETLEISESTESEECKVLHSPLHEKIFNTFLPSWEELEPFIPLADISNPSGTLLLDGAGISRDLTTILGCDDYLVVNEPLSVDEFVSQIKGNKKFKNKGLRHVIWSLPKNQCDPAEQDALISAQEDGILLGVHLVKALGVLRYGDSPLQISVVTWQTQKLGSEMNFSAHASIHGFIGVVAKEYPRWSVRLVDLPMANDSDTLASALTVPWNSTGKPLVYRLDNGVGKWYEQMLLPLRFVGSNSADSQYRKGGVYVVFNGGEQFDDWLSVKLTRDYDAQIIWVGRKALDEDVQEKIRRFKSTGREPTYLQADTADLDSLTKVYRQIQERFGAIDGVVICESLVKERSVNDLDEDRLIENLKDRVVTNARIVQVFSVKKMDFMLFLSSMKSLNKMNNQSNHASVCTFGDVFSHRLAEELGCTVKIINWSNENTARNLTYQPTQNIAIQEDVLSFGSKEMMTFFDQFMMAPIDQMVVLQAKETSAHAEYISGAGGQGVTIFI